MSDQQRVMESLAQLSEAIEKIKASENEVRRLKGQLLTGLAFLCVGILQKADGSIFVSSEDRMLADHSGRRGNRKWQ